MAPCRSRMAARQALAAAIAATVALADVCAIADPSPPPAADAETRAEARFRDGSQAFDAGRVEEACADFSDSLLLFSTLGTLLNLALCHEKQGKMASAWREFTHAAAWASQDPTPDRRDFAHQHALRLERSLSRGTLEIASNPEAITIEVDGIAVDVHEALPLFFDPGAHVITARAPLRKPYVSSVTVPAVASSNAIVLHIPTLPIETPERPLPAPQTTAPPTSHAARRTAGWITGGTGLALVATGVYFGIDAITRASGLGTHCTGTCDPSPVSTSEAVSLVSLGVGAAALVAGAWLIYVPAPKATPTARRAHFAPELTARSASLGLAGTW